METSTATVWTAIIKYIIFPIVVAGSLIILVDNFTKNYVNGSAKLHGYTSYINTMQASQINVAGAIKNGWPFKAEGEK